MYSKIYIRASMLPSAQDCMRKACAAQFRKEIISAGYTLKKRKPIICGIVGSSVHNGSEYTIEHYLKTGKHSKPTDCIEIAIDELKKKISDGIIWDNTTYSQSIAEKQIIQMIRSYCIQIAPNINPASLPEKQLEARIGKDIIFTGKNDLETIEMNIRDIKTGVKIKSYHAQQGGYSLLRKAEQKKKTNKLIIDYLPRISIAKKYPGAKSIEYDVNLCERLAFDTIMRVADCVRKFREKGNCFEFPCNPSSILCSEKYCIAFGTNFCRL